MATVEPDTQSVASSRPLDPRLYWAATMPFLLIFGFSAVWSLVDPDGTRADTLALGFPSFVVYPQAIAKILGLVVILSRRSRILTGLAFAGFLYDVLLALGAHLVQGDLARASLAVLGIVATATAFWAYERRYPPTRAPRMA